METRVEAADPTEMEEIAGIACVGSRLLCGVWSGSRLLPQGFRKATNER